MKRGGENQIKFYIILFVILFSIILSFNLTSAVTRTCSSCGNCTAEIGNASAGDVVQLNQSLLNVSVTRCVDFGGTSNISFNCQNNIINGNNSFGSYGIFANGVNNITIRNCNISNFYQGLLLGASSNDILTKITASNNTGYGIFISISSNNILTNITSNNNSVGGVYLQSGANNNTFDRLITNFNSNYGVYILSSSANVFKNTTANNNSQYGFYLSDSSASIFSNITVADNLFWDIYYHSFLYCDDQFLNVTGSGNLPIKFFNSSSIIQNKTFSELLLCDADYSNIQNIIITGSASINNNGLFAVKTDYSNFTGINSSYNYDGIYLYNTSNNVLNNITANSNSDAGANILYSLNNTLTNINIDNQLHNDPGSVFSLGISLSYVNNTIFANVSANNNSYGFQILYSSNNIFNNISANSNAEYGIYFFFNSFSNIVKNSFIQFNTQYGLYFQGVDVNISLGNIFYNNYFNNSAQYYNSTSLTNFFNTTKILGTNIVGGTYLGGNYWAAPNGSGFSQTCSASTDGICDTAFSLDGVNFDYLPLTCIESWSCGAWNTCVAPGTQTRTCTDANYCQTYKYQPITSQSCTAPGGGGTLPTSSQTSTISSINSGGSASVDIQNPKIDIRNITLNAKNNITNASLTVSEVQNTSAANFAIRIPFGTIYQAFHINTSISNTDLNNVNMEFRVEKKWLTQNNRTYSDVVLYRIPSTDSTWQALATTSIKEDAKYYYFLAISPGFSTFVILVSSVGAVECMPLEKRCFNKDIQICSDSRTWVTTKQCESSCLNAKCTQTFLGINIPIFYYGGIIAVGSAIIIVIFFMFRRIGKKKEMS